MVTETEELLDKYQKFFEEFAKLPNSKEPHPTFMEIAGYGHHERLFTQILSFFLDTTEVHDLNELMLKSLLDCLGERRENDSGEGVETKNVFTDFYTSNRKYIDIFLETTDFDVIIENKIYAPLNNPLDSYSELLNERNEKNKKAYKIVLSLRPLHNPEIQKNNFENVIYSELVKNLQRYLGYYFVNGNNRYLTLLSEFIETIENHLNKLIMDEKKIEFFNRNYQTFTDLVEDYKNIEKQIEKNKVKEVQNLIDKASYEVDNQWIWQKFTLVHDFKFENITIAVDTWFTIGGIRCTVFARDNEGLEYLRPLEVFNEKLELLEGKRLIAIKKEDLPITTSNEQIADKIKKVLSQIRFNN